MAKTSAQLSDIAQALDSSSGPIVILKKTAAPYTTVVNRAQMTDLSQDLGVRMGIERFQIQQLVDVFGEIGPNGEYIFKPANDIHDQVRIGGKWSNNNDSNGTGIIGGTAGMFIEITYYGTGLNLLAGYWDASCDLRLSMDGGAEGGSTILPANVQTAPLSSRNYASNRIVPVASNQTLGFHTAKLRLNTAVGILISGFEILNESSSLKVSKGSAISFGSMKTLSSVATVAYNSGFESGTLGTRGGRVLVYQKADGSIGKAVTPADSAATTLTSTNHANEEVIRTYHWREFGAGRSDDFSTLVTSGSTRAYTLDDGTTTLTTNSGAGYISGGNDALRYDSGTTAVTITFVGTGLDIIRQDDINSGGPETSSVSIDGAASVGSLSTTGSTTRRIEKIVAGLPYGTHTVKITRTSASFFNMQLLGFVVWGPKKPTLPTGAAELADYCVMADFAANTTAGTDNIATGVLRKSFTREAIYVNGTGGTSDWTASIATTADPGFWRITTDRTGAYVEYTFVGVGFEWRGLVNTDRSSSVLMKVNGVDLNSSFSGAGSITISTYGNAAFGAQTANTTFLLSAVSNNVLNTNGTAANGGGFRVSGLPYGKYTVRFTNNTTSHFSINTFDAITLVHSPKMNGPYSAQNTLSIGSQSINDGRNFGTKQIYKTGNASQSLAVTNDPTGTTTGAYTPIPDLLTTHNCKTGLIEIAYVFTARNTAVATVQHFSRIFVDGVPVGQEAWHHSSPSATVAISASDRVIVPVSIGAHTITVMYRTGGGTFKMSDLSRILTVRDVT